MKVVRSIRLVSVITAVGALLATALATGPANAASRKVPASRSGLMWASGAFEISNAPAMHNAFGSWRKARTDIALTYSGRQTWADIVQPTWLFSSWQGAEQTLVISSAPFPESGGSLLACARGLYDAQWKQFGVEAARHGMAGRTIVRLGWEFNGSWVEWQASDPVAFVGCWRKIFKAAESTAPALRWDWTVNRGVGDALLDARKAWPGIGYVDIVGVDSYDGYPPATTQAGWNTHYAGPGGLKFWADFARSKGKRLSVPEWGLYPGTAWAGHNGGDNPLYIARMFGFFRQQRDNLAYEAYFNDTDPAHASALPSNPRGGAEYRRQIIKSRETGR